MADHLVSATLIQRVLRGPLGPRAVGLGVDRDTARLFDPDDAMKVSVEEGRIRRIGKQLRTWNAVDTGVFLATPELFDALEDAGRRGRYALCHGIESLAEGGQVQAVDVTGEPWIDVDTPASLREARRRLLQSLGKNGADGYIAAHLNRRLSVPISAWLARTPITPTQITVISFLIALLGAAFFTVDRRWTAVIGALLVQLSSVVDGCDGELARLRHLATARGGGGSTPCSIATPTPRWWSASRSATRPGTQAYSRGLGGWPRAQGSCWRVTRRRSTLSATERRTRTIGSTA